jgi:hypothetical protein
MSRGREFAGRPMRATIWIVLALTVAGAYALGRQQPVDARIDSDLARLDSFRSAFEQGNQLERSYRFHGFLQSMGPDDVAEAAESIERWNPWLATDEMRNFMIAWAAFDPEAALSWGIARSGSLRAKAAAAALEGWAFHDPVAARDAMEALDPRRAPGNLEEVLVAGWLAGGRHSGVFEYIESRPAGINRQRYTNLLTIELMRQSPDEVIRWVESIENAAPGAYKTMAFQKAANILASSDPAFASSWIETHFGQGYVEKAPGLIGRRWLEIDPEAALEWLTSLPRGAYDEDVKSTLRIWLNQAPEDAQAWVRDASPAAGLDPLIEIMISRNKDDPRAALDWSQRIHDPATRQRTVLLLGRKWLRRDPDAAKHWIEESGLSQQMKSSLLKHPTSARAKRRGNERPTGNPGVAPSAEIQAARTIH